MRSASEVVSTGSFDAVRLVIARCSVDYAGRLSAHLPEAVRLIMVKADGCVAIHADGGAYKPLNWMNAPNTLVDNGDHWVVAEPQGRALTITLHEVLTDSTTRFGVDPGLQKDGVEAHLQELLAASPHAIEPGLRLVRREYPTAIGPIDLVCRDAAGQVVAIEVKRRGEIDGVEQLGPLHRAAAPRLVARRRPRRVRRPVVKPQARVLAEARGFRWVEVDYDELRGMAPDGPAAVLSVGYLLARHAAGSAWSRRPGQGRAGQHRDDRRPRPRAGRGGRRRSRPAGCATPTCTTARAGSTTTSRSCSATRRPASSSRSATASPTSRPATT